MQADPCRSSHVPRPPSAIQGKRSIGQNRNIRETLYSSGDIFGGHGYSGLGRRTPRGISGAASAIAAARGKDGILRCRQSASSRYLARGRGRAVPQPRFHDDSGKERGRTRLDPDLPCGPAAGRDRRTSGKFFRGCGGIRRYFMDGGSSGRHPGHQRERRKPDLAKTSPGSSSLPPC
jgi:hypothetical protein